MMRMKDRGKQQFALRSVLESAVMRHANTLKQWTGKSTASVVYDSTVDECTDECIFQSIKGTPNVEIVAFTTEGDSLAGSSVVTEQGKWFDTEHVIFSFESHGWCETPERFDVKECGKGNATVKYNTTTLTGLSGLLAVQTASSSGTRIRTCAEAPCPGVSSEMRT